MRMGGNSSMIVDSGSETKPIYSAQVTDYLQENLTALLDSGDIQDSFFCEASPDGKHFATGAYDKSAHILDINATAN